MNIINNFKDTFRYLLNRFKEDKESLMGNKKKDKKSDNIIEKKWKKESLPKADDDFTLKDDETFMESEADDESVFSDSENKRKKMKKEKKEYKKQLRACFTNRELSWLKFNERVLNEAGNPRVPLAERLTFASIFQTNLDEFFMVRVGTLMFQMNLKEKIYDNKTSMSPKKQIKEILLEVNRLEKKKGRIYEQLMGELEPAGIRLINFDKLSISEGKFLEQYFDAHISPFLTPMIVDNKQPFPFLANKQLYAVVVLKSPKYKKKIGIVPCSNSVFHRLIEIPTRPGNFMLSEDLILHFINKVFPYYEVCNKSILRVTRNADMDAIEIRDEDMDYRALMETLLKKRTRLNPVRVEISGKMDEKEKEELAKYLNISTKHILYVRTPLDLSFVFALQDYLHGKSELFYHPRKPQLSANLNVKKAIIPQILERDVLLSYPFESMRPFLQMLQEAAEDDDVVSIKMTLYRVASQSKIIETLINAADNGKEVVVILELRARFDEANNIDMSRRLEQAGCRIIYGLDDYKVHSKLCLISRKVDSSTDTVHEANNIQYISQIGTGNYNEKTAKLYTDLSLITANQEIGAEIAEVFATLLRGEVMEETRHLLVAPKCLQSKVLAMIDEQIVNAAEGREAYVGAKINSLTDKEIMLKLIEASQAGVKIDLIVRGICCLKPGIAGFTDHIRIISVVGRYLEHSRIYLFGTGDEQKVYIASADYMTRNTIRRVEVATPIYDKNIKAKVLHIFRTILLDDEKGKEENSEGFYVDRKINEEPLNSQELFFQEAYDAIDSAES